MVIEPVVIGDATLYLADCKAILPLLPTASVDAIIADPPYGIDKAEWDIDPWKTLKTAADECARILKSNGICFWFSSIRYLPKSLEVTAAIPYRWQFIWYASNNMQHGDLGFVKYTPCLVLAHNGVWRDMQDLRNVPLPCKPVKAIYHPTEKPLTLMTYLVGKSCGDNDLILDPFMGSGSTGVAAVMMRQRFVGIETDERWFNVAVKRIREAQMQLHLDLET